MSSIKHPFIILLLLLILFGCKKYDNGPYLSLYSKEHRITGNWNIEYLGINGYDSTTYFKNSSSFGYYEFKKYENGRKYIFHSYLINDIVDGFWQINNKKDQIHTAGYPHSNVPSLGVIANFEHIDWTIKRLTEKEMWLESNFQNRIFFVKYKQK